MSFALDAFLRLGLFEEAHRAVIFLVDNVRRTYPWFEVFWKVDGGVPQRGEAGTLPLDGYRGSQPVQQGNHARDQLQLGNYGDVFESLWLYYRRGNGLDDATGRMLATTADFVCCAWQCRDSGIWEVGDRRDYTSSKMGCWVALDRALRFAQAGVIPSAHAPRWRASKGMIESFVRERCWSERLQSYTMAAGTDDLDASCLLAPHTGFEPPTSARVHTTVAAIVGELGEHPLLYRYSGMREREGAFVACSFWLARTLATARRFDEAAAVIDGMVSLANDVGLLSEEIDPGSHEMLGNFPQGLSHFALVNAASTFDELERAVHQGEQQERSKR
jgi:GH15 family glucan-1,4-alpha-glucosidase